MSTSQSLSSSAIAGRAMDARIATEVMGWTWVTFDSEKREWLSPCTVGAEARSHPAHRVGDGSKRRDLSNLPRYSTDIASAMQVVERMIADGWRVYIDGPRFGDTEWRVMFAKDRLNEWALADTLPLAICRASLKALDRATPAEANAQNHPPPLPLSTPS